MNSTKVCLLLAVLFVGSASTFAQNNPNEEQGLKPYDSFHGGDLDSVSLTSGGLSLHIPLASFPQRGNLDLSFMVAFSNKQWYVKPAKFDRTGHQTAPAQWAPMPNTGVQIVSSTDWWLNTCGMAEPGDPNNPGGQTLYDWSDSVSSPDGSSHLFGDQVAAFSPEAFPVRSFDGTGLLRPDAQTVILPNGTRYIYPVGGSCTMPSGRIRGGQQATSVTDANGNQITTNSSGWTDTMGRFIPGSATTAVQGISPGVVTTDLSKCPSGTTSARIWNVPGISTVNGGIRTYYFCYSMFPLSNSIGGTLATSYGPVSTSLLSAVVLPDLTMWTFTYDTYGDVQHVGFPTGGSLAYTYATGPFNSNTGTGYSTWVMSRTVDANDGTGGHQWTYNYQGNFPTGIGTSIYAYAAKGIATVTSPDGNDVVHTIGPGGTGGCPGYEYQTQYFQGSASGGVVLKTNQNQYSCTMGIPGGDLDGVALNAVPTQVTTISPGAQTAKTVISYDPLVTNINGDAARVGSVLERDDYDFSNTLTRSTVNRYLWQDNPPYLPINFVSLKSSVTLKDGVGNQVAQTTYGYDDVSRIFSYGNTVGQGAAPAGSARGNLNYVSRWLNTTNTMITTTTNVYDTGEPYQTIDPLGNVTTFSYSPSFYGTYLTQTNLPDTQMPDSGAPIIHHVISGNYDFNTGVLLSFTDENSQNYTYTYDVMLRLAQGNHPDGGITKFLYPDPNTVERQRLITGTTYDDFKVKFDGVGRPYQTQQSTPDCAGWIKVDTTYDSVGRAKTVSNPYCLTSESTYGITQTTYDAMSRTLNTTKQDGSITSVKYDDIPGDTSGAPLVCTTATDESGKKRQACSDAFARLVKVVEPNPGSVATFANGSVSVSGSEQSTGGAATSGSGTVTISGTEQSVCNFDSCTLPGTFTWDSGPVSITVNGAQKTVTYSRFSTPTTIATALAAAFHNDASAPADATSSGAVVTLTARATGAASNYSLSVSASSGDPTDFTPPSFSVTKSGAAFTGGHDAGVSDSGNVTITLNGTNYSTTFGAGDTPTSIASRLAPLVSAGPYASATSSAGTVNLTSKTVGSAGNFSLTASYTYNTGSFAQPSFTTSTSGTALANGKDASALNNNPFVTLYQYNARGDMLCVHQKATDTTADVPCTGASAPSVSATWRQRFFTYDSFSRLLTAMNPELNSTGSTVITYGYDNNSRLTSKTEPAPNAAWGSSSTVIINYTYDALNRLLDTTYSDGTTQSTSHRYDYASFLGQTFTNPIGREVAATAAGNTIESFTSYDPMGHVANTVQCNPGVTGCKTFTASYDKLGSITNLIYPGNGFSVTYGYDSAGRLTTATDSNGVIYAQTPTYLSNGAIQEFTSPNFANNKYHVSYNNRLQPIEIWAGSAQGSAALFDKQYSYGTAGANNGNIYTITNVKDSTRTQSFTYDPLNRLLTAGDQMHWSNTYVYDAWGNLYQKNPGSLPGEGMSKVPDTNNHLSGLTYDAGGHVINDGLGGVFVFDAENRIKTGSGIAYTYDADGKRIQKSSGANYWYGPGGNVFAETDSAGNWTNYIFFGTRRLARNVNGDIKYFIVDHLHSTSVFADKTGTILDDRDYYPWGGLVPGVGTGTSNNHYLFNGKERDSETGLDNFGARYYPSLTGRFMSPDPVPVSKPHLVNPQRWNEYAYALNNPVSNIDLDGKFSTSDHDLITLAALKIVYQNFTPDNRDSMIATSRDLIGKASRGVDHSISGQLAHSHQADHFLRYKGQSQHEAYIAGTSHIQSLATAAFNAHGDENLVGQAIHTIQDSYAHTTRNAEGQITHVACFTCVIHHDHHDPKAADKSGNLTSQGQGAVDATAAFVSLMNDSSSMTLQEFTTALNQFMQAYFGWSGPDDDPAPDDNSDSPGGSDGPPTMHQWAPWRP
jgi:RHS repeat-associated protein